MWRSGISHSRSRFRRASLDLIWKCIQHIRNITLWPSFLLFIVAAAKKCGLRPFPSLTILLQSHLPISTCTFVHTLSQSVQTKHPKSRAQNLHNYPVICKDYLLKVMSVRASLSPDENPSNRLGLKSKMKRFSSHIICSTINLNWKHQIFGHTSQRKTAYEYRLCFYMCVIIPEMGVRQL